MWTFTETRIEFWDFLLFLIYQVMVPGTLVWRKCWKILSVNTWLWCCEVIIVVIGYRKLSHMEI